jgi:hypothetical protein
VGSVLGALDPAGISDEWKSKVTLFSRIDEAAKLLVSKRR